MTPNDKLGHDAKITTAIEAYADARYRDGVKVGLDVAEMIVVFWESGRGQTKAQFIKAAKDRIAAAKRKAGL